MIAKFTRSFFSKERPPFMKITQTARSRILALLAKRTDPQIIGVKISLTKKGCNGLTYAMNYVKNANKFDEIIPLCQPCPTEPISSPSSSQNTPTSSLQSVSSPSPSSSPSASSATSQAPSANHYKIIVDSKALMALVGTEMDYVENQLGSQFVFNNPNQKGKCGCGESFHI